MFLFVRVFVFVVLAIAPCVLDIPDGVDLFFYAASGKRRAVVDDHVHKFID